MTITKGARFVLTAALLLVGTWAVWAARNVIAKWRHAAHGSVAPARYGAGFPRYEGAAPANGAVEWGNPQHLYLIVDRRGLSVTGPLPRLAALTAQWPTLQVVVVTPSSDARAKNWIRAHFGSDAEDSSFILGLDRLSRGGPFAGHLARSTHPWPSMAAADGITRETPDAYLLHGAWLIWAGDSADVKPVIEEVAAGSWSPEHYDALEAIRGELEEHARLVAAHDFDAARDLARRVVEKRVAQPARLRHLAQAMAISTLQDPRDVALARQLTERSLRETDELDADVLGDAALTRHLLADNDGATAALRRSLDLCRQIESDCEAPRELLAHYEKCPTELEANPSEEAIREGLPRLLVRPARGAPPECDPSNPAFRVFEKHR